MAEFNFDTSKRHEVHLPEGIIEQCVIDRVTRMIRNDLDIRICTDSLVDAGVRPFEAKVIGKGEYVGMLTKRIAKYLYKNGGHKLSPSYLGMIGDVISRGAAASSNFTIDFTQDFDWDDGDFGDDCSCYWGERSRAREILAEEGAYAIRFWVPDEDDWVGFGRAWIAKPGSHKHLRVMFNSYGYDIHVTARVLAHHLGMSYKRCHLRNNCEAYGLVYINNGRGYLIGPPGELDCLEDDPKVDLRYDSGSCCACCGHYVNEDGLYGTDDDESVCQACYEERYSTCQCCDRTRHNDYMNWVESEGANICDCCLERYYETCTGCGKRFHNDNMLELDGDLYCENCHADELQRREEAEEEESNETASA